MSALISEAQWNVALWRKRSRSRILIPSLPGCFVFYLFISLRVFVVASWRRARILIDAMKPARYRSSLTNCETGMIMLEVFDDRESSRFKTCMSTCYSLCEKSLQTSWNNSSLYFCRPKKKTPIQGGDWNWGAVRVMVLWWYCFAQEHQAQRDNQATNH